MNDEQPQNQNVAPNSPVNNVDPTGSPMPTSSPVQPPASNMPGTPFAPSPVQAGNIKNYRIATLLVVIFCSLPLGIAALIYSMQVDKHLKSGDVAQAQKASKTTKILIIVGVVIGLPLSILYVMGQLSGS